MSFVPMREPSIHKEYAHHADTLCVSGIRAVPSGQRKNLLDETRDALLELFGTDAARHFTPLT